MYNGQKDSNMHKIFERRAETLKFLLTLFDFEYADDGLFLQAKFCVSSDIPTNSWKKQLLVFRLLMRWFYISV